MDVNLKLLRFDWDPANSSKNKLKHAVEDAECEAAFFDGNKVLFEDKAHSGSEKRFILLGKTRRGRLLYIAFTIRGEKIRIISARDVKKRKEVNLYENAP